MTKKDDASKQKRRPAMFHPDATQLEVEEAPLATTMTFDQSTKEQTGSTVNLEDEIRAQNQSWLKLAQKGFGWGGLFITALLGFLLTLAISAATDFIMQHISQQSLFGWAMVSFLALALFALIMIAVKEAFGLLRLNRITSLRSSSEEALRQSEIKQARKCVRELKKLYATRKELHWGLNRLEGHKNDVLSAKELFILAEREVLPPLDQEAQNLIATAAKRVSIVTALSPMALLDVVFVAAINIKLLRALASLYGGRPGMMGLYRLTQKIISHLVITGGLALTNDLIQQLVGQRLTAKISSRLGEGVFNGALTARIGLAALAICRPLPYIERQPPKIGSLIKDMIWRAKTE